jgi:hypothetical protein
MSVRSRLFVVYARRGGFVVLNPLQYAVTMDAVDRLILSNLKQEKVFIEYLRELFQASVKRQGEKEDRAENNTRPAVDRETAVQREKDVWTVMSLYYDYTRLGYNHTDAQEAALKRFFNG